DLDPLPPPVLDAVTVAIPRAAVRKDERTGPAKAARPRSATDRRQIVMWSSAAGAVLLIGVVTFAVVRHQTRPVQVAGGQSPPPPGPPPAPAGDDVNLPPGPDVPKQQVDEYLNDARAEIDAHKYDDAAQIHAGVLEIDHDN